MATPNSLMQTVTWRETMDGKEVFVDDVRINRGFGATIQIPTEKVKRIFGKVPEKLEVIILEEI